MKNPLTKKPDLFQRLTALRELAAAGEGRVEAPDQASVDALLERATERMRIGSGATVVALAGATGSGKSSLFNALSGASLSEVGVRRPTTGIAHAAAWGGSSEIAQLLDLLDINRRHYPEDDSLEGLVLLDLPDHDSTEVRHRLEVDRLIELVDIFMWVVDPEKYADAALHEGYLEPLARYSDVTLVVLNQIDRLQAREIDRCATDLKRLLRNDGLKDVTVVPTSTRSGEGLEELRGLIRKQVESERAAGARLAADLETLAAQLGRYCGSSPIGKIENKQRSRVAGALAEAAGVRHVAAAVGGAHRRDAGLAMGWPLTRWLRRLRPDPLARLHLRGGTGGRTSLPEPTRVQRAGVENAIRSVALEVEADGAPWKRSLYETAGHDTNEIEASLDKAIANANLTKDKNPRWWSVMNGLQVVLTTAALVGFAWLALLFGFQWFQIPEPPTPEVREIPWPTLLLLGGLLAGFLLSVVSQRFAALGAARRKREAEQHLTARVKEVAEDLVLTPIEEELAQRSRFCKARRDIAP